MTRPRAWWPALWVTAAATAMVAIDLGRRILATNDEARFALLAQDMLSRGAWLFPELNGVAYNAKPPLVAWLIAVASWPAGHVTQLSAVLPSALAAVGTALVVSAVGRALFGGAAGVLAALAAITTQGWFLHARLPMPDMIVTFFVTAAVACLWPMVTGRAGPWWLGFYGSMAGAFWAKGAAALLALAVAMVWTLLNRRPGAWRALRLPAGLLLVVALGAPWWLGKLVSQPAAMGQILLWDNVLWYLPQSAAMLVGVPQHLVGILFPWVLVLPLVVWRAVETARRPGGEREPLLFALVWSGTLLVCLGIAEQQRLRYYLPLVPPLAVLIGWWGARAAAASRADGGVPWKLYAGLAGVLAVVTAVATVIRPTWSNADEAALPTSAVEVAVMAAGLVVMLAALVHGARRGRLARGVAVAALGGAVWVTGWYHWELERRNAAYNYPRLSAEVERLLPGSPVVATWGVYDLPLSFYAGRVVRGVQTGDDLRRAMAGPPRGSAVVTEAALAQVGDRDGLRVLPLDGLNFDSIVLVSYPAAAPPPDARR